MDGGIDKNGGGDSPDDEEVVSLQPILEQIFWIFSFISFDVSIY